MPFQQFAATLGAVILGDALVFFFIWSLWAGAKHERFGLDISSAPWSVIVAGLMAPTIGGLCIYLGVI